MTLLRNPWISMHHRLHSPQHPLTVPLSQLQLPSTPGTPQLQQETDAQAPIYQTKPAISTQTLKGIREARDAVTSSRLLDSWTVTATRVTQPKASHVSSTSSNCPSAEQYQSKSARQRKQCDVRVFAGYTPLFNTSEAPL